MYTNVTNSATKKRRSEFFGFTDTTAEEVAPTDVIVGATDGTDGLQSSTITARSRLAASTIGCGHTPIGMQMNRTCAHGRPPRPKATRQKPPSYSDAR